jgi:predicted membrane protein
MEENKSIDSRNIVAIILIVAGGLLLLNTFDFLDFSISHYIFSWKTILIAIGIVLLSNNKNRNAGYILIGIGLLFWLPSIFADYDIRLGQVFFPMLLIVIGVVIISRRGRHHRKDVRFVGQDGTIESEYADDISIFGGGMKRFSSKNFKGGTLTAIFGGSEIDLTSAELSTEGAVIDAFTMFGGTKLIVPGSWHIKSDAVSIFGGFNDKRHIKPEPGLDNKKLLIKGFVMFGGVEIKSF